MDIASKRSSYFPLKGASFLLNKSFTTFPKTNKVPLQGLRLRVADLGHGPCVKD
jgi:hypothetical protein